MKMRSRPNLVLTIAMWHCCVIKVNFDASEVLERVCQCTVASPEKHQKGPDEEGTLTVRGYVYCPGTAQDHFCV